MYNIGYRLGFVYGYEITHQGMSFKNIYFFSFLFFLSFFPFFFVEKNCISMGYDESVGLYFCLF